MGHSNTVLHLVEKMPKILGRSSSRMDSHIQAKMLSSREQLANISTAMYSAAPSSTRD